MCRLMDGATGDRGQRYEVRATQCGEEIVVGWTEAESGGPLYYAATMHPGLTNVRVIDRRPAGADCLGRMNAGLDEAGGQS